MRVVDLGGTVEWWLRSPVRPAHVTVVNLFEPGVTDERWLTPVTGDACEARTVLRAVGLPVSYDLVFSNSLIEHVGGHAMRVRLSDEVHQLAPYHWVQTPYRYFPLEPHWLFPLMQFLPVVARGPIARRWPLAHTRPASPDEARDSVMWTELLSVTEMKAYFPRSTMAKERLFWLTKSLIAIAAPESGSSAASVDCAEARSDDGSRRSNHTSG